jgi:hypothetical protein
MTMRPVRQTTDEATAWWIAGSSPAMTIEKMSVEEGRHTT